MVCRPAPCHTLVCSTCLAVDGSWWCLVHRGGGPPCLVPGVLVGPESRSRHCQQQRPAASNPTAESTHHCATSWCPPHRPAVRCACPLSACRQADHAAGAACVQAGAGADLGEPAAAGGGGGAGAAPREAGWWSPTGVLLLGQPPARGAPSPGWASGWRLFRDGAFPVLPGIGTLPRGFNRWKRMNDRRPDRPRRGQRAQYGRGCRRRHLGHQRTAGVKGYKGGESMNASRACLWLAIWWLAMGGPSRPSSRPGSVAACHQQGDWPPRQGRLLAERSGRWASLGAGSGRPLRGGRGRRAVAAGASSTRRVQAAGGTPGVPRQSAATWQPPIYPCLVPMPPPPHVAAIAVPCRAVLRRSCLSSLR